MTGRLSAFSGLRGRRDPAGTCRQSLGEKEYRNDQTIGKTPEPGYRKKSGARLLGRWQDNGQIKNARSLGSGRFILKAGDDLLSRWTHYHRPRVLIGRVRNGNGSFHSGLVTGSFRGTRSRHFRGGAGAEYISCNSAGRRRRIVRGLTPVGRPTAPYAPRFAGAGTVWPSVRLLVPVSSGRRRPCTPGLSTRSSPGSLRVRRPDLEGSFTLICLQRLSVPHVATQRYG